MAANDIIKQNLSIAEQDDINNNKNVYMHLTAESGVDAYAINGFDLAYNHEYSGYQISLNEDCSNLMNNLPNLNMNISQFFYPNVVVNRVMNFANAFLYSNKIYGYVPIPEGVVNLSYTFQGCSNIQGIVGAGDAPVSLQIIGASNGPMFQNLVNMYKSFYNAVNYKGPGISGPLVIDMYSAFYGTKAYSSECGDNVLNFDMAYMAVNFSAYNNNHNVIAKVGNNVRTAKSAYEATDGVRYLQFSPSVENADTMYRNCKSGDLGQILSLQSFVNGKLTHANNMFRDSTGISHSIVLNAPNLMEASNMFTGVFSTTAPNVHLYGKTIWFNTPRMKNLPHFYSYAYLNGADTFTIVVEKFNGSFANWYYDNDDSPLRAVYGGLSDVSQRMFRLVVCDQNLYNTLLSNPFMPLMGSTPSQITRYESNTLININLRYSNGGIYKTVQVNSTKRYLNSSFSIPFGVYYCPDLANEMFINDLNINLADLSQ